MKSIEPKDLETVEILKYLLGGVAPRPIALVSTISENGIRNLSPFSFFNAFGANPPVVVFSASRRVRDGSTKDTFENLLANKECVIHAVPYELVQQTSLASTEYDSETDEFIKSGLTPIDSDLVKPSRVKESPFQMEAKLIQMISLGEKPGSGNLAVCEIVKFHIDESILENGIIHPDKIRLVGRNSADYYTQAFDQAIFSIEKPIAKKGIGFDNLPNYILKSEILTANNLGQLANVEEIPSQTKAIKTVELILETNPENDSNANKQQTEYTKKLKSAVMLWSINKTESQKLFHQIAKTALDNNNLSLAWDFLLYANHINQKTIK